MNNPLEKLAAEALTALETYNRYDIKTDRYAHSTELIYELRAALDHKRQLLREPRVTDLFKAQPRVTTVFQEQPHEAE
jgi:hypothetical protein